MDVQAKTGAQATQEDALQAEELRREAFQIAWRLRDWEQLEALAQVYTSTGKTREEVGKGSKKLFDTRSDKERADALLASVSWMLERSPRTRSQPEEGESDEAGT